MDNLSWENPVAIRTEVSLWSNHHDNITESSEGYNTGFKEKLELNEALLSSSIELQRILAALQTKPKPRDPRGLPAKESCRGPRRQLSYRVGSLAHITRSALSAINTALYLSYHRPLVRLVSLSRALQEVTMAAFGAKSLATCLVAAAFLAYGVAAADAPAPSPTSAAGALSPSLAVVVLASSVVALFGSLRH
ncbi:hypothetical protein BHM03_00019368 [Ensete ventricosum]|nr:hypothetical protein BHM03_00019368 [Ensete ventricosum]